MSTAAARKRGGGGGTSPAPPRAQTRGDTDTPVGTTAHTPDADGSVTPDTGAAIGADALDDSAWGILGSFWGAASKRAVFKMAVTHGNIAVYATCFWMTQPILPFRTQELGADKLTFAYLQTLFSIVQLVGGPLVGRVCDRYGARFALQVSQFGSGMSYLLMGLAGNVEMLFIGQLFTMVMHAMHSAQAFITDLSAEKRRAAALGRLSLSYGLGMIIGGPLGGLLTDYWGYAGVGLVAAATSFALLPLNQLSLPGQRVILSATTSADGEGGDDGDGDDNANVNAAGTQANAKAKAESQARAGKAQGLNLGRILTMLQTRAVLYLVVFQLIMGTGLSVFRNSVRLFQDAPFKLEAKDMGMVHSFAGALGVLANVVVVPFLLKLMSEGKLLFVATSVIGLSMVGLAYSVTYNHLLAVIAVSGLASSVMYTVATSTLTTAVSKEDTGTSIGLSHMVRSVNGIVAPMLSGLLVVWAEEHGYAPNYAVGLFVAAATAASVVFLLVGGAAAITAKVKAA